MATATTWAMVTATRVAGDGEGESDGGNSNGGGDEGRLHWGRHLRSLRAGCLAHDACLSPFVGVGAGLTSPVGIGKDGGHGGWLVLGVGDGVADYRGTKN